MLGRPPGRELHFAACAACGLVTATFGGLARDVLLRRPGRILCAHAEVYAAPAFLGGLATTAWLRLHGRRRRVEAVLLGVYATVHCRVFAAERGWRLPAWATAAR